MNIYAECGDKVVYVGGGYDSDNIYISKLGVKLGDVLTVIYTDVHSWNTDVRFEEIPGYHNSVMFEDYYEGE